MRKSSRSGKRRRSIFTSSGDPCRLYVYRHNLILFAKQLPELFVLATPAPARTATGWALLICRLSHWIGQVPPACISRFESWRRPRPSGISGRKMERQKPRTEPRKNNDLKGAKNEKRRICRIGNL